MSAITMNNQQSSQSAPNQLLNGATGLNFDNVNQTLENLMVSDPFPLQILDSLVNDLHYGNTQARSTSQHILVLFKESDLAWTKVDDILQKSDKNETKFFALQTLEHTIDKRWKILPREQCEGIRNFIIAIIIKISEDEETMKRQKLYLNKLNLVLVKILKHDWPQHWPTALQDIVGSARNGESICQNNLEILRLLSEEIFDFSEDTMVQNKIKHLKETMCEQFSAVFELCYFLMDNSDNESLILTCLKTLLRFTSWVPYGYIFETELIKKLTTRLLPYHFFRNTALACLTEIAGLPSDKPETQKYEKTYLEMFKKAYTTIEKIIPDDLDMREAYKVGTDKEQKLIQNLALFLTTFCSTHSHLIPKQNADPEFIQGYKLLVQISYVDDVEIFKICLDFWHNFAQNLYSTENLSNRNPGWGTWGAPTYSYDEDYKQLLNEVRKMMLCKMAKPEEVLVVENDQGQVVREVIKDTDSHILYQNCKETLVFLTNLDTKVTENLMDKKLSRQVDDSEWSWDTLNRLCWSIGSISGAMTEDDERRFLVNVIKDLLGLCEQKRGKDNKAIIASNIMYVVGQYPRFLRAHWKFLKTVVNKLFEFMHETHDGVQDMACDTFLKIAQKCKNHFVSVQNGESIAFIDEILSSVKSIIADLQPHQIQAFYEALGYMIAAQKDPELQPRLIAAYMVLPNDVWEKNIQSIGYDLNSYLNSGENLRHLSTILKTNHRACKSLGHAYIYQLSDIFSDMINIYKVFSEHICAAYQQNKDSIKEQNVKEMRAVKKEILTLTTLWINSCKNKEILKADIITRLLEPILQDYTLSPPEAKEPEVIACTEAIIKTLGENSSDYINVMFAAVFESTLGMISSSDSEFPEHRTYFFKFLSAINTNVFTSMLKMNETQFKLVLDAIIWGMKQMMQECKETSLKILEQLLKNVANSQLVTYEQSQQFYKTYYVFILEHIFEVSTNILHAKANLHQHASLLAYMIKLVDGSIRHGSGDCIDIISIKLAPQESIVNNPENQQNNKYIYNHIANLLKTQFGNQVVDQQIQVFVEGLFTLYDNSGDYISHLRDFLIQMKEKRGEDTEDLFLEERMREIKQKKSDKESARMRNLASIPGMSNQYEGMGSIADE